MAAIDAVVFDLDGTLCVRERDDEEIHEAIFERVAFDPFFEPADVRAVDPADLPPVDSTRERWEAFYRAVADRVGGDPERAPALADATMAAYVDDPEVRFREGAREALRAARERHDVALVTNGSERAQGAKLDALGIRDAFDATVFCGPACDLPGKPDPEPFERALDALGAAPERSVYVGNWLHGDVTGAHNAGMRSVWVPDRDPPADPDPEPDHRLESMAEVPDVL